MRYVLAYILAAFVSIWWLIRAIRKAPEMDNNGNILPPPSKEAARRKDNEFVK